MSMRNNILLTLSILTFICALVFFSVVIRWNNDMNSFFFFDPVLNNQLISPVPTKSVWTWIIFCVSLGLIISFLLTFAHILKYLGRLSLISLKTLSHFDWVLCVIALTGWLTWVIYFYHVIQYIAVTPSQSFGSVYFDGVEIAFGVLTCVFAGLTAFVGSRAPQLTPVKEPFQQEQYGGPQQQYPEPVTPV